MRGRIRRRAVVLLVTVSVTTSLLAPAAASAGADRKPAPQKVTICHLPGHRAVHHQMVISDFILDSNVPQSHCAEHHGGQVITVAESAMANGHRVSSHEHHP